MRLAKPCLAAGLANGPTDHSRPIGDLGDPDLVLDVLDAIASKLDRSGPPYELRQAYLSTWLNTEVNPTGVGGQGCGVLMQTKPSASTAGHDQPHPDRRRPPRGSLNEGRETSLRIRLGQP
jgi:hypothetical protein